MPRDAVRPLILASSSPYRQALLSRLGLPFECLPPDIDETRHGNETPRELVQRLAEEKAEKIAESRPHALIIGSDQVAVLDDKIFGKPGNHERAVRQLQAASGKTLTFLTGLCLYDSASGHGQSAVVPCPVTFRTLEDEEIEDYLRRERPWQCAGAFKSEGLGIALLEEMPCADPTALIGLPLIRLSAMLKKAGFPVLAR